MVSCKGLNGAGQACSAQPIRSDGYCYWHSPQTAAERADARRGGRGRSNQARARKALNDGARDLVDVRARLMGALAKVEAGELSPPQASAMAALTRAITAVVQVGEFEERLAVLEAQIGLTGRRSS